MNAIRAEVCEIPNSHFIVFLSLQQVFFMFSNYELEIEVL